jgi:hypothetical protein
MTAYVAGGPPSAPAARSVAVRSTADAAATTVETLVMTTANRNALEGTRRRDTNERARSPSG